MKILFGLIIILITTAGQLISSELKTNRDIIDSLTIDVISTYQARLTTGGGDSLLIGIEKLDREAGNYLKVLIGNFFSKNSFRVFRNYNQVSSFQGLIIEIADFKVEVKYSKPFEKSFFGKDFVRRQINFKIKGQIYTGNNQQVEQAIEKETMVEDEIPYASISEVDESPYEFTRGEREEFSFWEKMYEPVITVASVAVIVYLFFTQRS